ncbi:hypothetical protein D3C80_586280 [compost metagenome]
MGKAIVEVPAIAARGAPTDPLPFENDHPRARLGQLARGPETGEAAADDGDIIMTFDGTLRGT